MKRIWFEKCEHGKTWGIPHGYLHVGGKGKHPVTIFSVEAGEIAMDALMADKPDFSREEREEVCDQFRAAGLAEEVTDADLMMLNLVTVGLIRGLFDLPATMAG
jgi:hypothetical protein